MWETDLVISNREDQYDLPFEVIVTAPDGGRLYYCFPCRQTAEEFAEEILSRNS